MPDATLLQILDAREKRVELQKKLLSAYKTPLICFTMNIAGPQKTSPLIERAFFEGMAILKKQFSDSIIHCETDTAITGCQAMLCVDMAPQEIKSICTKIENTHPLGRLFDMDVLDPDGKKLSRHVLRGCIVCGKEGRECAAGRLHSVEELQAVTKNIINDYFFKKDAERFGNLACESLLCEVYTTPKPGLVDRNNNGSHNDMDIALFEKSANALAPYFRDCIELGYKTQNLPCNKVFLQLRKLGIQAEKDMFAATDGINTHKGAVFSFGVVCTAVGRLWSAESPFINLAELFPLCADLTKEAMYKDFNNLDTSTAGGRLYKEYLLKGIRGEAASGFSSVKKIALPIFSKALQCGLSKNDAGAITLLHLISEVEDTTIYHRGGKEGADFAKSKAKQLIFENKFPTMVQIQELDKEFIRRNLSAGGCADLLALTYFIYELQSEQTPNNT